MEMCPSCSEPRNMIVSSVTRTVQGEDQKEKKIKTLSHHCEQCHRFMRSEDEDAVTGDKKNLK